MLKTGFDRTVITPPVGVPVMGYFVDRTADTVLDDLELNTVAFSDGKNTVVLISMDLCEVPQKKITFYREKIADKLGIDPQAVFIVTTHTHTGPFVSESIEDMPVYDVMLGDYLVSSAGRAIIDLKPSKLSTANGELKRITFIRRYRMKDGTIKTNPGLNNPDIVEPIGEADETLSLVKIAREGAGDIAIINFAVHPDVIGGNNISADYPRFVRETMEDAIGDDMKCIFVTGHCGDLNALNLFPKPGELNNLKPVYPDNCLRGYEYARHMGRSIAGEALKLYGVTVDAGGDKVKFKQKVVNFDSNMPTPQEMEKAKEIVKMHEAGKDNELPWKDMELTTYVAEALRMVALKDGPESFALNLSVFSVGKVVFAGVPGEPFCEIGRIVREESPYNMTINMYLCNGGESYYPTKGAYDEGGYEARSCYFKSGTAEAIAKELGTLIKSL